MSVKSTKVEDKIWNARGFFSLSFRHTLNPSTISESPPVTVCFMQCRSWTCKEKYVLKWCALTVSGTVLKKETERYGCTKINRTFYICLWSAGKGVGEKKIACNQYFYHSNIVTIEDTRTGIMMFISKWKEQIIIAAGSEHFLFEYLCTSCWLY